MRRAGILGVTVCLLMSAAPLRAAEAVRYQPAADGSKVRIDGKTNLHDWSMEGTTITGFFEVPAGVDLDPAKAGVAGLNDGRLAAREEAAIPVASVKSQHEAMDMVMLGLMKAEKFPTIDFRIGQMDLAQPHLAGQPLQFQTKGELVIAGVTNTISMPVRIESGDKGGLKATGSLALKMTSYNIQPPSKQGIFTTDDQIVVSFVWLLLRSEAGR